MFLATRNVTTVTAATLFTAAVCSFGRDINTDYITPPTTFSPDQHYGVTIPVFHIEAAEQPDQRRNKVVDRRNGEVVAIIQVDPPGYDRALNHHEAPVARWSSDSSVLL